MYTWKRNIKQLNDYPQIALSYIRSTCYGRTHRFNPWFGKIPWRRKWQPTPVFLPGKSHGQRNLAGYSPVFVTQLCPTLCDPTNCSPPGSSIHGILHARILEWIAIPFPRGYIQSMRSQKSWT